MGAQAQGRLGNAYLLAGPAAIGKATLVQALATQWLCQGGTSCGSCAACLQIAAGTHPDVHLLFDDGEPLKVEAVRALQQRLSQASVSPVRLILLAAAERLTVPAANSLLKLLEEPPARTSIFLTSARPDELLPTIRSRCRRLAMTDVPAPALKAGLAALGFAPEDITKLQHDLPYLRPGEYIQCLRNQDYWTRQQALDQAARQFLAEPRLAQGILQGEAYLASVAQLQALLTALVRLLHWQLQQGTPTATLTATQLAALTTQVAQAHLDLTRNVNRRLVWENLVLSRHGHPAKKA